MKFIVLIGALVASIQIHASEIHIGLFDKDEVKSLLVTYAKGSYHVVAGGDTLFQLAEDAIVRLSVSDSLIKVRSFEKVFGSFREIMFVTNEKTNNLRVKSLIPEIKTRKFDGNLQVTIKSETLSVVNVVDMERYVSNVVKWESGKERTLEYYKVQSIICRTYALSNINKHINDGFQMCDKVHCQVYKGQSKGDAKIIQAVISTRKLVIVDNNVELILATFHSNCGGQTMNSEDVWGGHRSYLRSVVDTYCINQSNSNWEKRIDFGEWKKYLTDNQINKDQINVFAQSERKVHYNDEHTFRLTNIRKDWKLRSTFFTVSRDKREVVLNGKGYGHGVGLCQEGAIHMAELGFSFKKILEFYYNNVKLVSLKSLGFFKEE
ncbi:MAG: SpoIID/LytB domain-containing protein [Bacteroidetes bacterium]|nr:SpoIID/LytB domain-containing protein [Bacteroidota bacterium]